MKFYSWYGVCFLKIQPFSKSYKSKLLNIRKFDDKIINVLNAEIPTESFYTSQKQQQQPQPENIPAFKCKQLKNEVILLSNLNLLFYSLFKN